MSKSFDVVIVGARCAGSPLAALVAREGVSVAPGRAGAVPKDTLSTHAFQADATAFLDRLGLTSSLRIGRWRMRDLLSVHVHNSIDSNCPIP